MKYCLKIVVFKRIHGVRHLEYSPKSKEKGLHRGDVLANVVERRPIDVHASFIIGREALKTKFLGVASLKCKKFEDFDFMFGNRTTLGNKKFY